MSNAHADDKIVTLRERFGMWGVGVYWSLVERVAEQMKSGQDVDFIPVAVFDVSELCSFCRCKRNKLETFLRCLRNIHGIKWERNGNIIKIEIQKLSEIKDNYHTDLEETSRHLPSKEVEVEVEVEQKKIKEGNLPNEVTFTAVWQKYPNRQGRKNALRHFNASVKSAEDLEKINRALENYLRSGNVANGFIKNGSTWFNEWQDWIDPTETMMRGNKDGKLGYFPPKPKRMKKCEYCNQEIIEDDYWTKHWIEGGCPKYKLASAETVHKAVEEIKALTQSMRVDPQKGERQR